MNIKDFSETTLYEWPEIFKRQREINNQFDPDYDDKAANFDISYHEDQELFKHYCWCITEELMEAIEAVELSEPTHIKEEVIDALNFTIQLYGLYGWGFDKLEEETQVAMETQTEVSRESMHHNILSAVYSLGMAANCLKNRQWRESQYLVDLYVFEPRLRKIWHDMLLVCKSIGLENSEDIRKLWDLKYQVNKFRIESKY